MQCTLHVLRSISLCLFSCSSDSFSRCTSLFMCSGKSSTSRNSAKHTESIKFQNLRQGARSLGMLFDTEKINKFATFKPCKFHFLLAFLEGSFSLYMSMYAFVELLGGKSRRFDKNGYYDILYIMFYKGLLWHFRDHKCRTRRLHTPGKGTGVIASAPWGSAICLPDVILRDLECTHDGDNTNYNPVL